MFGKNSYRRAFTLLSGLTLAASVQAKSFNLTGEVLFIAVAGILIFCLLVFLYMIYALDQFLSQVRKEEGFSFGFLESWKGFGKKLTGSIPVEREEEVMTDHVYDGIIELDNRLPPWWVYLFYATIIFSVFYIGWYHILDKGPLQEEEYMSAMKAAEKQKKESLEGSGETVDENTVTLLTDAVLINEGRDIFSTNCAACHGNEGQGTSIAPNLTDEYWLHGGGVKNVFRSVKYGIPEKGMISWQNSLSPSQMEKVAGYIISLQGTNPPNPKAPEGEKWTEAQE